MLASVLQAASARDFLNAGALEAATRGRDLLKLAHCRTASSPARPARPAIWKAGSRDTPPSFWALALHGSGRDAPWDYRGIPPPKDQSWGPDSIVLRLGPGVMIHQRTGRTDDMRAWSHRPRLSPTRSSTLARLHGNSTPLARPIINATRRNDRGGAVMYSATSSGCELACAAYKPSTACLLVSYRPLATRSLKRAGSPGSRTPGRHLLKLTHRRWLITDPANQTIADGGQHHRLGHGRAERRMGRRSPDGRRTHFGSRQLRPRTWS